MENTNIRLVNKILDYSFWVTQFAMIIMKLMGILDVSWWWVLSPTWASLVIALSSVLITFAYFLVVMTIKQLRRAERGRHHEDFRHV